MLSATQSLDGKLAKLPSGWAYTRDRDSVLGKLLQPLAAEHVQFERQAEALLPEAPSPRQAVALLPDFERVLGPDPCLGPAVATRAQRQQTALARWTARGGASRAFFVQVAAQLGYTIRIEEFRPRRFGQPFGQPFYGAAWAFVWRVVAPATTVRHRGFGEPFGEPYRTWGGGVLECTLSRLSPEHTVLLWRYEGTGSGNPPGVFVLGRDTLTGTLLTTGTGLPLTTGSGEPLLA